MKRVVVTGANKGIGLAIVEGILDEHSDSFVYLGARDAARGEAARAGLIAAHPEWADRVAVLSLDVANAQSVADAAARVREESSGEAQLHGIVNNAGIGFGASGMEAVLDVNTRGVRRVCEAFLPLISSEGGRIVNVTSASGPNFVSACNEERQQFFLNENVTWDELDALMRECTETDPAEFAAKGLGDGNAYGLSKACANTYTLMLAKAHPELEVNACTPGFIATDLTAGYAEQAGKTQEEMGMKTPAEGARSPLYLLFGDLEGNGRYYGSDAKRSPMHRYRSPGTPPYDGD